MMCISTPLCSQKQFSAVCVLPYLHVLHYLLTLPLATCVQVNAAGNVLLDSFVAQKEPVTDYRCAGCAWNAANAVALVLAALLLGCIPSRCLCGRRLLLLLQQLLTLPYYCARNVGQRCHS
jgi:hypothetical protein